MSKDVEQIPIKEESPQFKRITWWIENAIVRSVKRVINGVSKQLKQILSFSITDLIEEWEKDLIPWVQPLANEILSIDEIPEYIKLPIRNAMTGTHQVGLAILALVVGIGAMAIQSGFSQVFGRVVGIVLDRRLRTAMFDPGTALAMLQKGIINQSEYEYVMAGNGVRNVDIARFKRLGVPLYDDNTLTQLMWRKEVSGETLSFELSKRGMTEGQIAIWKRIRQVIPSPSELISIAVREGFNDAVAARFGYDEDYPTVAAEYAEKQGMRPLFFKAAWRAHWNLPGLVQVRDMYHRDIINDEEVRVYLKAADLPIFWRNALIKWMDRIVTRVDSRRMYSLGIWDDKRVYEHHKQLGYNDQDASDMTMWVALNYMENDRELTKTDVLTMYQDGILNTLEATTYLEALDYRPQAISLLLAHRDLKREEAYERQVISNIKALYVGGLYDRTDVFAKLGKLATPDAVIKQNLAVWDLEKERKVKVPTVTQLKDMVLEKVITIDTFRTELSNKRYPARYIEWYVKLWF